MTVGDDTRADPGGRQAERSAAGSPPVLVADPAVGGTGLILFPRADSLPAVWVGPVRATGLEPDDVAALLAAARPCSLLPEHGEGWFGRPGLSGHRLDPGAGDPAAGRDWSPLFVPTQSEHDGRRARIEAADKAAGLRAGDRDRGGAGRRDPGPAHAGQPRPPALRRRQPGSGLPVARAGRRGPRLHRAADRGAYPAAPSDRRRIVAARRPPRSYRPRLRHHGGRRGPRLHLRQRRGLRPARRLERQHRAPRRAGAVRPGHDRRTRP